MHTYGTAVLGTYCGTVLYSISNNSDTQTDLDAASRPKIMSKSLPWVLEEIFRRCTHVMPHLSRWLAGKRLPC